MTKKKKKNKKNKKKKKKKKKKKEEEEEEEEEDEAARIGLGYVFLITCGFSLHEQREKYPLGCCDQK